MVFQRYASPFLCIDQFIEFGKFSEFVAMLYEKENEERLWQFYLHKVDGKSFDEFKVEFMPVPIQPKTVDTKKVIEQSIQILKGVSSNSNECI